LFSRRSVERRLVLSDRFAESAIKLAVRQRRRFGRFVVSEFVEALFDAQHIVWMVLRGRHRTDSPHLERVSRRGAGTFRLGLAALHLIPDVLGDLVSQENEVQVTVRSFRRCRRRTEAYRNDLAIERRTDDAPRIRRKVHTTVPEVVDAQGEEAAILPLDNLV